MALVRLVASATILERRLFRSAVAQVRLLFESGVYSRAAIRSYPGPTHLQTIRKWAGLEYDHVRARAPGPLVFGARRPRPTTLSCVVQGVFRPRYAVPARNRAYPHFWEYPNAALTVQ